MKVNGTFRAIVVAMDSSSVPVDDIVHFTPTTAKRHLLKAYTIADRRTDAFRRMASHVTTELHVTGRACLQVMLHREVASASHTPNICRIDGPHAAPGRLSIVICYC